MLNFLPYRTLTKFIYFDVSQGKKDGPKLEEPSYDDDYVEYTYDSPDVAPTGSPPVPPPKENPKENPKEDPKENPKEGDKRQRRARETTVRGA
jgi:hypothetical protein